jgi:hypothetical protein
MSIQGEHPSIFLSDEDVAYLTGYEKPSFQFQHLTWLGIPAYPDRLGRPRVPRAYFEVAPTPEPPGPNLEWLAS